MADQRAGTWVPIVVAIIGVVGVIAAALIAKDSLRTKDAPDTAPVMADEAQSAAAVVSQPSVAITGVLIGKAGADPFVSEVITRFASSDEVAITVRYSAKDQVSDFPVRLSASVFSFFGNGAEEQTTDVSRPGNSFWTFRFKPKDGWLGTQQFVSVEINGEKAYGQEISVYDK